ncbi:hypothetical protein HPT27_03585 [Permianibacter sp. IMCC34836]|uniref:hypothetical protein n=1 Tax=Permianibacter fluminis TaxID=2738515 RepID=UPI00155237C3|nr:hypothetical protein [Permianibacter fluminis]NQD36092.1 hypothetical protein [Permianibacter fluminis]
MSAPTINDMMVAYAEDAVDFARNNFGVSLDYTAESVEKIEVMANRLFQAKPKGFLGKFIRKGPSEEEIQTVCKMLGGYIGEVYRRTKGGEWAINQEYQTIGLTSGEAWIFPPAKVHKRLTNGTEDNLQSYFRVILEQPW